jgi:hypothetical protein
MKAFFLTFAVLVSTAMSSAHADVTGVKTFPITEAQLAAGHFDQEFNSGNLTVNYDEKKVTLILNRKFQCPAGTFCAMVMPAPKVVELPITSVDSGNCGATLVSAQQDSRTRDGILEQINVTDNTTMFCRILLPYEGTATYVTSGIDRLTGQEVTETSKLILGGHATRRLLK